MFFWKRGCCCESTNHKSCGCPYGTGTGVCSGTYGHDMPEFPGTITIDHTRWSLGAISAAGNADDTYDWDNDCCNGGRPCSSPDGGFCGTCAEGSTHPGGADRLVAGDEIEELESSKTITLTLQDGTNGRDGDPAPTACKAYYRGVVRHDYDGTASGDLQDCDCEEGYGVTHGGYWEAWRVVLELKKYPTGRKKTQITATITMANHSYLEWITYGDVTTPPDDSSLALKYIGTYSAEFIGIGNELGEDINGNQDCGYCYFPYDAFNNLELSSGGDTDPGSPPMADGIDTDMATFGTWDVDYCCDPLTGICYCTYSPTYPTWYTYWWEESTLLDYFDVLSLEDDCPVVPGRCESERWGSGVPGAPIPPLGSLCDTASVGSITPPGNCEPDCDPPPCDYSGVDCLVYQNPYTYCLGELGQVYYTWTFHHYLNVSLSI